MDTITILEAVGGYGLAKSFRIQGGRYEEVTQSFPKKFNAVSVPLGSLNGLSALLTKLEKYHGKAVIRGDLKDTVEGQVVVRQFGSAGAPFKPAERQWLCIDVDSLSLPADMTDFNVRAEAVALFAVAQLPPEFQGISFHWQFSGSMGVKPGIRIHLWFWLSRAISDPEAINWLARSATPIDMHLYNPIQLTFTANPIFDPPDADPVRIRSGLVRLDRDEVKVPNDLNVEPERPLNAGRRHVVGGKIDLNGITRNEAERVVDGREKYLQLKTVDAIRELSKGKQLTEKNMPDVEAIARLAWEMMQREADLSDGKWDYSDALRKSQERIRNVLEKRWNPNGRTPTTTLIPEVEPYFRIDPLPADEANGLLEHHLGEFFGAIRLGERQARKLALRVTMGAGKTTRTIEHLKRLLVDRPELNIEIYLPRHDLIRELLPRFKGLTNAVQLVHMRGRGDEDERGEKPCRRYDHVRSLEVAGISVSPNACRRSEFDKCQYYDDCAYWGQYLVPAGKQGTVRLFPHASLAIPRNERLPLPDLVIIDEAFLSAICKNRTLRAEQIRELFRGTEFPRLGDWIVEALQEGRPLLTELREREVTSDWLRGVEFGIEREAIAFDGRSHDPRQNLERFEASKKRFAETLSRILAEELGLPGREHATRVRWDPRLRSLEVNIDWVELPAIPEDASLLILDATADYGILKKLFGEIEFRRVDFEQNAIVTQVFDRTGSNTSWDDKEDRVDDLIAVLREQTLVGDQVLCISHKVLADRLREVDLNGVAVEHFGNLRGIDAYREFETVFITGRNQPPQAQVDGMARALWWNDDEPLSHDEAAMFGADPGCDLPIQLRGYLTTDPEEAAGVYVRSFSDQRTEAIHQQIREAETVQAIARLRLVYSKKPKLVYLLGNLPIEMPIDRIVSWKELMPNEAERELKARGNIPLTATGWQKMRPDIYGGREEAAKKFVQRNLNDEGTLMKFSPWMLRQNSFVLTFRRVKNGKQIGGIHSHLFIRFPSKRVIEEEKAGEKIIIDEIPLKKWLVTLIEGYPDVEGSGWGEVELVDPKIRLIQDIRDSALYFDDD
jgi:hypothetical protein